MINRERLIRTFCELVKIDSPSGEEDAICAYLKHRLEELDLTVFTDNFGNIITTTKETNPLMLSCHVDTVEPGRGIKPKVVGDRIVSDGTTILGGDAKAGLASILEALDSIKEDESSHIPFQVVLTRAEETGLLGARNLDFSMITSKEAIVFDGEGPVSRITSAAPTYIAFDLEVTGRAAHAGVEPEKGLSAILIASEIITRLPQGRLDEETTFNIGTFEGGSTRNTVPEHCLIRGEFRSRSLESLDDLDLQLTETIDKVSQMFPEATIEKKLITEFETYTITNEDPSTKRVIATLQKLGLKPTLLPSGGGTDGNIFRQHGISAVVVGMADNHMHTVREYVTIPDLMDAASLAKSILTI